MPYPTFKAGAPLTAADLSAMQWQQKTQGSNQTVNNSTTFVDSSIVIPVAASATYLFILNATYTSGETPDIKFEWTAPVGASVLRWSIGPGSTSTGGPLNANTGRYLQSTGAGADAIAGGGAGAGILVLREWSTVTVDTTAGNMTLRFAQNTANASDTILQSSARVDYLRIG